MGVVLVGMNHRTAPVELRERVAFDAEATLSGLEDLARRTGGAEAVVLSTCNRVEVTAFADEDEQLVETVERFLAEFHGIDPSAISSHLYRLRDTDAVRHLFRVASSLDSMVPGESQILAQVKEAYLRAAQAGYTGKHLNVLFQRAFGVGKRVHTHTEVGRRKASISSVAVELAASVLGELSEKTVLVIGAGETGKLTLRSLVDAGVSKVLVANRTPGRARDLAGRFRGTVVDFTALGEHLRRADIVIACTASRDFVLWREDVAGAVEGRSGRDLFIIDIAVPRDVHPAVGELPGVHLYDIDDLEQVIVANIDRREREFERCLEIVNEAVTDFAAWFETHEVDELIGRAYERVRAATDAELEKLWSKLPELPEANREEIREAVHHVINHIMHGSVETLRSEPSSAAGVDVGRVVQDLFRLDVPDETESNAH